MRNPSVHKGRPLELAVALTLRTAERHTTRLTRAPLCGFGNVRLPFSHSEWWRNRATLQRMQLRTLPFVVVLVSAVAAGRAFAQPPAPEPEAPWEIKLGASFVGTSGNSDTASSGASFEARRQWDVWRLDASASAVRTSQDGEQTAEQYLAAIRAKRRLTDRIAATSGLKLERDRLAGLDFRSLLDGGLA